MVPPIQAPYAEKLPPLSGNHTRPMKLASAANFSQHLLSKVGYMPTSKFPRKVLGR